jgi:hypothetical protein
MMGGSEKEKSFLQQTHQYWKVTLTLALVGLGGVLLALMIWRVNDDTSLPWVPGEGFFSAVGTGLVLLGLLWLWLSVRCPRCRARVAATILTKERTTTWLTMLLDFEECPGCGFRGGSSPKVK